MAAVDHRGHAVKTESVKVVFVQPELAVTQQEMQYFVLAVVKTQTVPCRVFAAPAVMEILVTCSVEVAQSFQLILDGMAVYQVHDHMHSATMHIVNQRLQFVRRAETTAGSKEIRYMVSETSVVGVFLDGHNLDAVIT